MLNKVFLEGIVAKNPKMLKAINGKNYCFMIIICKMEQQRTKDDMPVLIYPDDIIPIVCFNKLADYVYNNRKVGDVVQIEGSIKTPNRKVMIQARSIKLIKSAEFKKYENEVKLEAEKRRYLNERSSD